MHGGASLANTSKIDQFFVNLGIETNQTYFDSIIARTTVVACLCGIGCSCFITAILLHCRAPPCHLNFQNIQITEE